MKSNETTLYVVLFCVMVILGWMFVIYAPLRTQVQHTENMINRKLSRIETRAALPEARPISQKKLEQQLGELKTEYAALMQRVEQHEARFVSLETVDGLRELRLEIANLAETSGLEVKQFGTLNEDGEITDSLDALSSHIRAPYGRLVLSFQARGSFPDISNFVKGLGKIERSVAILRLAIQAPDFKVMTGNKRAGRLLSVRMDLAL